MIRDPRAKLESISLYLLEHLQQVVEDTATRDWPAARHWTQNTFDAIERGDYGWPDTHQVQFERLRCAIAATRPSQTKVDRQDKRDMPCRDFNSQSGCAYSQSHQGRNVVFAHVCSLCFNQVGDRSQHAAKPCPRAQRST